MPMEYGTIEGMNKKISRILQGTMMLREDDLQESFDLLDGVWALGVNGFDGAYITAAGSVSAFWANGSTSAACTTKPSS